MVNRDTIDELGAGAGTSFGRVSAQTTMVSIRTIVAQPRVAHSWGSITLQRVLNNLVINACEGDGTRGASRVLLRCSDGALGKLLIEVVDDGPGFSPQRLSSPFVAFKTTKASGSGLGLYTAKRLVEASTGTLNIRNGESGFGAVVQVALPRREPA